MKKLAISLALALALASMSAMAQVTNAFILQNPSIEKVWVTNAATNQIGKYVIGVSKTNQVYVQKLYLYTDTKTNYSDWLLTYYPSVVASKLNVALAEMSLLKSYDTNRIGTFDLFLLSPNTLKINGVRTSVLLIDQP